MVNMINANDPKLKSWVEVPNNSDFPIQNLPFGIFSTEKKRDLGHLLFKIKKSIIFI